MSRRGSWLISVAASAAVALTGAAALSPRTASADAGAAPTSLSPSSPSEVHKDLELQWQAVAGATGYQVELLAGDGSAGAPALRALTTAPRWTVPVALPAGSYAWHVRTMAGGSAAPGPRSALAPTAGPRSALAPTAGPRSALAPTAGPWSALAPVRRGWADAPTPRQPLPGAELQLAWSPIPDASSYELEVSPVAFDSAQYSAGASFICFTESATFTPYGVTALASTALVASPGSEASCAYAATPAQAGGVTGAGTYVAGRTYFWRVRGRDGTVDTRTTPFPAPSGPASGSCTDPWQPEGATVAGRTGTVTVILPSKHTPGAVVPDCSGWSVPRSFVYPAAAAAAVDRAPTQLAVGPRATGSASRVLATPTFSWAAVPGALRYRFFLSPDRAIGSSDLVAETLGASLTPVAGAELDARTRYWAVQACGAAPVEPATDRCGPVSAAQPVTQVTVSPAAPVTFVATRSHLLATWSTGMADRSAAMAYDVLLTSPTGARTTMRTDRIAADLRSGTSSLVIPVTGIADGSYRFQVRTIDQSGRGTAYSALSPVATLDRSVPALAITNPGLTGLAPLRITATVPVTGVSPASLTVVDAAGVTVPGTLLQVTTTSWAFTPAQPWLTGGYLTLHATGVVDAAGEPVPADPDPVRTGRFADSTGPAMSVREGDSRWTVRTSSDAVGGSYRSSDDDPTTPVKSSAVVKVYGTSVAVRVCMSPTGGSAQVFVDGELRLTSSLYRSWTGCANVLPVLGLARGEHTVIVVGAATDVGTELAVDQIGVG